MSTTTLRKRERERERERERGERERERERERGEERRERGEMSRTHTIVHAVALIAAQMCLPSHKRFSNGRNPSTNGVTFGIRL